jgi:hypothetical protein
MVYLRCAFVSILFFLPVQVWAWGCNGHEIVALIAEAHLTPPARAMVKRILENSPIDPSLKPYCKQEGLDLLASSSTWADDYRSQHPETEGWHFIDIPRGAPSGDIEKYCPPASGCITMALKQRIQTLRTSADSKRKADALRFVIHLMGDIHQPLHDTTNNDRGGNCVPVDFFDEPTKLRDAEQEDYSPNLHNIWDSFVIQRIQGARTVRQFSEILDKRFHDQFAAWQKGGIQIDEWAWQSHQLAESKAYGNLPRKIAIEAPLPPINSCAEDDKVGSRMFALHEAVGAKYQSETVPVIQQQLAKAGIRLAMILNDILK